MENELTEKLEREIDCLKQTVHHLLQKTYPDQSTEDVIRIPIENLPAKGTVVKIGHKKYRWTEVNIPKERNPELQDIIKEGEAALFSGVYTYFKEGRYVKLFKKNITPHYIPEDAVKAPADLTQITKEMSEKTVEAGAWNFWCNLDK